MTTTLKQKPYNHGIRKDKSLLTYGQITNCILETPQRVKPTVSDNTLTLPQSSVIIVPYGTSDLSATYPVGAQFVNENFKVVDTQYLDGKFFVWAEIQNNPAVSPAVSSGVRFQAFEMNTGNPSWNGVDNCYSGATAPVSPSTGVWWYDTTNNYIKRYVNSAWKNWIISFPTCTFITDGTNMNLLSTFNGIGFIGATIFVDKGVKGLMTNEKNPDGTFNSIPYVTAGIMLYDMSDNFPPNQQREIILQNDGTFARTNEYVIKSNGYLAQLDVLTQNLIAFSIGHIITNGKSIISMKPKQAFQAADVQDIDGCWIGTADIALINNQTYPTSKDTVLDLSDILPKDDNIYECLFEADIFTGNTAGNYINCIIGSSATNRAMSIVSLKTPTNYVMRVNGNILYPVGRDKKLKVVANNSYVGRYSLMLKGYRKVR